MIHLPLTRRSRRDPKKEHHGRHQPANHSSIDALQNTSIIRCPHVRSDIRLDETRKRMHEGDGGVFGSEMIKRQGVEGSRLVDDGEGGPVFFEAKVIFAQGSFLAAVEDAEDAGVRRSGEEGEEVGRQTHAAVVGEGEAAF